METTEILLLVRGAERLLIEAGAITCIVLGTRLFRDVRARASELSVKAPGYELQLREAAPGTFLALFGVCVLIYGLFAQAHLAVESIAAHGTSAAETLAEPRQKSSLLYGDEVQQSEQLLDRLKTLELDVTQDPRAIFENFSKEARDIGPAKALLCDVYAELTRESPSDEDSAREALRKARACALAAR
jgi:hypothetical protein